MTERSVTHTTFTIELAKESAGTILTYTEQGAYLDGLDLPEYRKQGTAEQFDNLTAELQPQSAADGGTTSR